ASVRLSANDGAHEGTLDEVGLFNRALSSNEIAAIYSAGSAGVFKSGLPPTITAQPASQVGNAGDSVSFSVVAVGTEPLTYQWRKDGELLAGATQSSLTLTNLQGSDAGNYDVVVSNAWGSVASAVALLSVNLAFPDSFSPGADN